MDLGGQVNSELNVDKSIVTIWLVVWKIFIFPYIGNNNPNWHFATRAPKKLWIMVTISAYFCCWFVGLGVHGLWMIYGWFTDDLQMIMDDLWMIYRCFQWLGVFFFGWQAMNNLVSFLVKRMSNLSILNLWLETIRVSIHVFLNKKP